LLTSGAMLSHADDGAGHHQAAGTGRLGARCHTRQPPPVQASSEAGTSEVAGRPKDDIAPGTLNSILKQAGLKD